jgi:anti-sigma factor RsiW
VTTGRPITEEDLHALVDNALDPARTAEVAVYLEAYPEVAERVEGYRRQRNALRDALNPVAAEPVPADLTLHRLIERRRHASFLPAWRAIAASILLLGFGAAGGWSFRGLDQAQNTGIAALAQEATDSFAVFGPDHAHPVEIRADNQGELVRWLSYRLQHMVAVPDLAASGFRFMGGRLIATAHGAAGFLMYDNDHGIRLAMLVRPMQLPSPDTPMAQNSRGDLTNFAWIDNGVGYSLVGPAPAETLRPLAQKMRQQIQSEI